MDSIEIDKEIKSIVKTLKSKIKSRPQKNHARTFHNQTEILSPNEDNTYDSLQGVMDQDRFALAVGKPFNDSFSNFNRLSSSKLEKKFVSSKQSLKRKFNNVFKDLSLHLEHEHASYQDGVSVQQSNMELKSDRALSRKQNEMEEDLFILKKGNTSNSSLGLKVPMTPNTNATRLGLTL